MAEFFKSLLLMFMLLNPFLVIIYLVDAVEKLDWATFTKVLLRAGLISVVVFCCFGIVGDLIFSNLIQAEFASFQIFGGVVFLLIGLQFVFKGPRAMTILRGDSEHISGAIAMPVLIGPGTISASVLIGKRLPVPAASLAIFIGVMFSIVLMLLLKMIYDRVHPKKSRLIERYTDAAGRITALYVGTISIEMIMLGIQTWIEKMG